MNIYMNTSQPIELTILSFNKLVSLNTSGLLYNNIYNPQFDSYDAIANVNVDLKTFKNIFCFETDYLDINDVLETDIKYYVLAQKIPSFIPSLGSAIVNTNPMVSFTSTGTTELNQLIGKDFTRYLAFLLFNTSYGTDLFINETTLVDSVSSALGNAWLYCLTDLQNVSNESNNPNIPLVGNSPAKYLTNNSSGVQNICRELFLQLITKSPARFTNLPELSVEEAVATPIREGSDLKYYYLPFVNNDIIQLRVKVKPSLTQPTFGLSTTDTTKFENVDNNTQLKGRTYLINMVLSDNLTTRLTGKCSIKVVGKNSTLSTLDYLPIIQNNNIMNILTINTIINANTIQTDIYYDVDITRNTSSEISILDVGFGFSTAAITYYNANIQSVEILQFGGIPLYGKGSQFKSLTSNIIFSATDSAVISPNTSLSYAFAFIPNFNVNVNFLNNWNLSNVSDMSYMFNSCSTFNNGSLTNDGANPLTFTTSSALLDASGLFYGCANFNQIVSITNITNVTTIYAMFRNCAIFNNGSLTDDATHPITFTTSSALLDASGLFYGCANFNQIVSITNITNVTTIYAMFRNCAIFNNGSLTNDATHPITFTTSSGLTLLTFLFTNCYKFNQRVSFTNLSGVTNASDLFSNCYIFNNGSLTDDGANPITFNTSSLISSITMFLNCSKFNQNVSINASNCLSMAYMFQGCSIFNNGSLTDDATHPITFTTSSSLYSTAYLFNGCYKFNQVVSITNMSGITNMLQMFQNCSIFNNGSLTDDATHPITFTTSSSLLNVQQLFNGCSKFNQQVSITNMSKVTNTSSMFLSCLIFNNGSLTNDGANPLTFTTSSSLLTLNGMFQSCRKLNQTITLGDQTPDTSGIIWNINIPNATNISTMFWDCRAFNNGNTTNIATKPMRFKTSSTLVSANYVICAIIDVQNLYLENFNQEVVFSDMTGLSVFYIVNRCRIFNNGDVSGSTTGQKPLNLTTSSTLTNLDWQFAGLPAFNQTVTITNISNVTKVSRMFELCTIFNNGYPSGDNTHRLFSSNAKPTNITTASSFTSYNVFGETILRNGNLPSWIQYVTNTNKWTIV